MATSEIIYQGLHIVAPGCKYYQVKTGPGIKCYKKDSVYVIEFPEGAESKAVAEVLGITHHGASQSLIGMVRPERFKDVVISLNGLRFKKLTYDPHTIKILLVSDNESRVIQKYTGTTIVVSKDDYKNPEFMKYVLFGGGLKYLVPIGKCPKDWEFRNFPYIPIMTEDLTLVSDSEAIYSLRNRYDDYRIRSIDYQEQFITEIRKILEDYGVELVRVNREKTLETTAYVSYSFNQTPIKDNHPYQGDLDAGVLQHRVPVEFEFRCTNMQMFYDFKNRYSNVNLLTDMTEFRTADRYGERWTAAVKWGPITEDFNHTYSSDNNSNFSYQCSFRAELFFYEVYDKLGALIMEVNYELSTED